jgi:hypothetical protein
MPGGWMTRQEAMAYFGVDEHDLERIAVDYELDVDVDADGRIFQVYADDATRNALFAEHERKAGHRPDDPKAHAKVQKLHRDRELAAKRRRRERRARLQERVRRRASLTKD